MNILITGGAGFIGTNCAINFGKNKKNSITILDNFSRPEVRKNASFLKNNLKINVLETNINNVDYYKDILKKSEIIIHLAGQTAVTTSINNPKLDFESNLNGGFRLLDAVRQYNPRAILIYASTNKVYGDLHKHKLRKNVKLNRYVDLCHKKGLDENEKVDFISPYGCSKGAVDFYFQDYARIYDLKTVVFRQSCIYGPYQLGVEDQGWVAHFTKQFLQKKPISIFGDGLQVRDLLHVEDLVKAYETAINNINTISGQAFNIGGGIKNAYSILEVIKIIKKITGNNINITYSPERQGDQKYYVSSNRKLKEKLNWRPMINFKKGILDLINWQKQFLSI